MLTLLKIIHGRINIQNVRGIQVQHQNGLKSLLSTWALLSGASTEKGPEKSTKTLAAPLQIVKSKATDRQTHLPLDQYIARRADPTQGLEAPLLSAFGGAPEVPATVGVPEAPSHHAASGRSLLSVTGWCSSAAQAPPPRARFGRGRKPYFLPLPTAWALAGVGVRLGVGSGVGNGVLGRAVFSSFSHILLCPCRTPWRRCHDDPRPGPGVLCGAGAGRGGGGRWSDRPRDPEPRWDPLPLGTTAMRPD